jgi:hypothetical protein
VEPAGGRQEGGEPILVESQEPNQDVAHLEKTLSTSPRRADIGMFKTGLRGWKTKSHAFPFPAGWSRHNSCRIASRMRLRIRFRTTALPNALGTVKPTRDRPVAVAAKTTENSGQFQRLP